jgi:hypothetical protein
VLIHKTPAGLSPRLIPSSPQSLNFFSNMPYKLSLRDNRFESSARTTKRSRSLVEIPGIAIRLAERRNMVLRCLLDGFLGHVHEDLGFLVTDPVDMLR